MSKMSEAKNRKKLLEDLSTENLTDEEIVNMWKAPAIAMINNDMSTNFKLQQFLISKGVSREFAQQYITTLKEEAEIERRKTATRDAAGSFLTKFLGKFLYRKIK